MNAITAGDTRPIAVEVLRSRLEAIGREAGFAVERTAISPTVSETKDYSVTIMSAEGDLVVGAGYITAHFGGSVNAVRGTLKRHEGTFRRGDVFLSNDPHNGGGLHAQDVVIQRPIFVGERLVAWVAVSAHMMDMGGMTPGSFAPHATECYQEALRMPSVRLFSAGQEVGDVWAIVLNNVRLANLIEADLRALVAGCNVAFEKIEDVVAAMGVAAFASATRALADSVETEVRRRVGLIADGEYRATGWLELGEQEAYAIPCTLTVDGDRLIFDYEGCPPELPRFFNTKPYIIQATLASRLHPWLGPDLPYAQPMLDLIEVRCPPRTLLNCAAPAPVAAAHLDAAQAAIVAAIQCLTFALAASPDAPERRLLCAPDAGGWALMTLSFTHPDGQMDTFVHTDGVFSGSPAGGDRDGIDLSLALVGAQSLFELTDVEVLESNYPILIEARNAGRGDHGPGEHRSGGACHEILGPHGVDKLVANMISTGASVPNQGMAGGGLGARTTQSLIRADGSVEPISMQAPGLVIAAGERLAFTSPTGGGYGDPLARAPQAVAEDVRLGRITPAHAEKLYAVALDEAGGLDAERTEAQRRERLLDRLQRAEPPRKPIAVAALPTGDGVPLFPGVVQVGDAAVSAHSGAVLAHAPDDWTGGCPTLDEADVAANGFSVTVRAYLDPVTGVRLYQEIVRPDGVRAFASRPRRWMEAGVTQSA